MRSFPKLLSLSVLLVTELLVAVSQGLMAQDRGLSRVLFENADFKIYSVTDPEVLPSISEPAAFGVLLLRDRDAAFLRNTSGLSFSGSSGQQSVLVYGTPAGVLPFIDKARFLKAGANLIWVVPKLNAEITEPVFRKNLPDSFTTSVRDDLF
jgi:hypothetical protein